MQIRHQLCLLALVAGFAGTANAQTTRGQLRAAPQPTAPAATAAIANRPLPGAPSASGLASPFPPSLASPGVPGTSAAAPGAVSPDIAADVPADAISTNVMGAGPYGTRGMVRPSGTGPLSNVDIARSFLGADGNRDGELTRAEAMRLTLMPLSFEEMDANHDDILTRSEYEEALR